MATKKKSTRKATKARSPKTAKKRPAKRGAAKASAKRTLNARKERSRIRMYRQGLGDCFLLTIPGTSGKPFYVVIDCGVILGTQDADKKMNEVVEHIIQTTGGHIHLLAATHEHWDHISGFGQARNLWTDKSRLKIDQVWLSWAEDKSDPLAKKLKEQHDSLRLNLHAAAARLALSGDHESAHEISSLLGFLGASAGSTADALEVVRKLSENLR